MKKEEIPLSELAKLEIGQLKASFASVPFIILIGALLASIVFNWRIKVTGSLLFVTAIYVLEKMYLYRKKKRKILEENKQDYLMSEKIRKALVDLCSVAVDPRFENSGEFLGTGWKPLRIEYYLSESLKGELEELLKGSWLGLSLGRISEIQGVKKANIIPKLLETSCLLFLKKEKKIVRVIIPSKDIIQEIFAQCLEKWASLFPFLQKRGTILGSHTCKVLNDFARGKNQNEFNPLLESLSAQVIVDQLAAACKQALEERPNVYVFGVKMGKGVVLGVRIGLDKENLKVVFPNRIYQRINLSLNLITKKQLSAPFSLL